MADYCRGIVSQVRTCVDPENFDLGLYLDRKCQTAATFSLFVMVE